MDELEDEYDVVVLGTDITQAIVAGYDPSRSTRSKFASPHLRVWQGASTCRSFGAPPRPERALRRVGVYVLASRSAPVALPS